MSTSVSKFIPYIICTIIGAVIAVGTVIVSDAQANTTSSGAGRMIGAFLLMQHSNPTASPGVFRVNVNTGYVSYCYIDGSSKPAVNCTPETP